MQSGADQLTDWMDRRSYSLREVAQLLGIDTSYVSLLMNGHRTPGRKLAIRIARLAGIPVDAWESDDVEESRMAASVRRANRSLDTR